MKSLVVIQILIWFCLNEIDLKISVKHLLIWSGLNVLRYCRHFIHKISTSTSGFPQFHFILTAPVSCQSIQYSRKWTKAPQCLLTDNRRWAVYLYKWLLHFGLVLLTHGPEGNGCHVVSDNFQFTFVNENVCVLIQMAMEFIPQSAFV